MRKIFTLFAIVALLCSFVSCSSDDNDNNNIDIVGSWIWFQTTADIDATPDSIKKEIIADIQDDNLYKIEFKSDGTGYSQYYKDSTDPENLFPFTYEVKGNKLYTTSNDTIFNDKGEIVRIDKIVSEAKIAIELGKLNISVDDTALYQEEYKNQNDTIKINKVLSTYYFNKE